MAVNDTQLLAMQVMGKNKVLVKVHPEGKYVVDLDKNINMADVRSSTCNCTSWLEESHMSAVHVCTSQARDLVQPIPELWNWTAHQHAILLVTRAPTLTGRQCCA